MNTNHEMLWWTVTSNSADRGQTHHTQPQIHAPGVAIEVAAEGDTCAVLDDVTRAAAHHSAGVAG